MELRYRTAIVLVLVLWAMAAQVVQGQIFVGSVSGFPQNFSGSDRRIQFGWQPDQPRADRGSRGTTLQLPDRRMYVLNAGGGFAGSIGRFTTGGRAAANGECSAVLHVRRRSQCRQRISMLPIRLTLAEWASAPWMGNPLTIRLSLEWVGAAGAMALSPDQSKLFVTDHYSNTIGEYDAATGVAINAALIAGLDLPTGIAISGSHLYVANAGAGTIGEYNLDGTVINAALVTGLSGGYQLGHIAVLGNSLYVTDIGRGVVGEYDATTGEQLTRH